MDIEISPFRPDEASRSQWEHYHRFRRLRHEESDPGDPIITDATAEKELKTKDPEWETLYYGATKEGVPGLVGWLEVGMSREGSLAHDTNSHMIWCGIEVLPSHRGQGIGRTILARAAEVATEKNRSLVIGGTTELTGEAFIEAIGAQEAIRWRQSRLYLDQVDWAEMERWVQEGERRSPDTRLRFFTNYPDEDVMEGYCRLLQEVSNQVPREELDVGDEFVTPDILRKRVAAFTKTGGTILRAVTQEGEGEFSGLTTMGYLPDENFLIHQWMTGVKDSHRGRGLGKWLKAAMILRVRENFPQVKAVVTGNATINAPMLAINIRMGFKPHKEGLEAQIKLEDLRKYLGR